jgi:hypothetical protein
VEELAATFVELARQQGDAPRHADPAGGVEHRTVLSGEVERRHRGLRKRISR